MYSSVCRSLSAPTRELNAERFKIGTTNDPIRRFGIYVDTYDEMILLYSSGSIQNVSDMLLDSLVGAILSLQGNHGLREVGMEIRDKGHDSTVGLLELMVCA
jgi:hypothetical protein